MRTYESIAIGVPEVLLPKEGVDLQKWAVVACDQFTSEVEYWEKAAAFAGGAPSALNLIYPEAYLGEPRPDERIRSIRGTMDRYVEAGIFTSQEGIVYVERKVGRKVRKGLVLCIDLDCYDYRKGAKSLIRATEGTILERIPPRVRIREGAKLEIPHIMVLIDDAENKVIGPVTRRKKSLPKLYDFDLMMDSGRLTGYRIGDEKVEKAVVAGLQALADPDSFRARYCLSGDEPVLLFAMGDGNHSLATAKAIWEKTREAAAPGADLSHHPARYALVEIVNLHDTALVFEPIHRVVFSIRDGRDLLAEMRAFYGDRYWYEKASSMKEMKKTVDAQPHGSHMIGVVRPEEIGVLEIRKPETNLPVGTLQAFLDAFMKSDGAHSIDYIHGTEPVAALGRKASNMGFYLPAMNKHELFKTVIVDGALPRKTFSMGEAWEKRFYMECRKIG